MIRLTFIFLGALGVAAVAGCYSSPNSDLSPATLGPNGEGTKRKSSATPGEGLPCEVARVLAASCTRCHGAPLAHGAPNPLLTYDDLVAPSSDPTKTVAEASLERMKASKAPMPPGGKVDAADIALLESWVNAGATRGECGGPSNADAGADAAAKGDGGSKPTDASTDAATTPSVCTSASMWTQGLTRSPLMHPGKACIACHSSSTGPAFAIAGTVYPTLHEPDDCNGVGAISVLIIDATGKTHTLPVNASGNFTRVTSLPMPYRAMVVGGGKVREMKTAQTNGDCNGCHTEAGNQSPGRVMAP